MIADNESSLTPQRVVAALEEEILAYRDELKAQGIRLTVEDSRLALDAYERYMTDAGVLQNLSPNQSELVKRFIRRIRKELDER